MPFFIPLIALISCFLLSSRREGKLNFLNKYVCFAFGFLVNRSDYVIKRWKSLIYSNVFLCTSIFSGPFPFITLCKSPLDMVIFIPSIISNGNSSSN